MTSGLLDIIRLDNSKFYAINDFLKIVVKHCSAFGAILWEFDKRAKCLIISAHWFEDGIIPSMHVIPVNKSSTGNSISTMKAIYVKDIYSDPNVYLDTNFWKKFNIKSFYSCPISYENGTLRSLNIYSRITDGISLKNRDELDKFASTLPNWHNTVHDRATYSLISKIEPLLKGIEFHPTEDFLYQDFVRESLNPICKYISEAFQAIEVSIFLRNDVVGNNDFQCIASTWFNPGNDLSYKSSIDDGLTGWILFNREAVYISDLLQLDDPEQQVYIQNQYPGIEWNSKGWLKDEIIDIFRRKSKNDEFMPPLGFMGVPISYGDNLLGLVRCFGAINSPYNFGTLELSTLRLLANRLGEVWNAWNQRSIIHKDSNTWQKVIQVAKTLDFFVLDELSKPEPNFLSISNEVLKSIPTLIRDAEILDVRLLDRKTNELYFTATYGKAWDQGSRIKIKNRLQKRFPVGETPPKSAGAKVYIEKKIRILDPIDRDIHEYDETFEEATRMIIAPLLHGANFIGVLDVRSTSERAFEHSTENIVELMAGQLGVYYELVNAVCELKNFRAQQIQTFKDFAHQARTPINLAKQRIVEAIDEFNSDEFDRDEMWQHLNAIFGLINKAKRVVTSLRLFSELSKGAIIEVSKSLIKPHTLIKLIKETVFDNEVIIDPNRRINVEVDVGSFFVFERSGFQFDVKLLEQALGIVLDNAVKYSYDNSTIKIFSTYTENSLELHVRSTGIRITEQQTTLCIIRGWRGEAARLVTGEGDGIGLWILDKIMRAHKCLLEIIATNDRNETVVKLIFKI